MIIMMEEGRDRNEMKKLVSFLTLELILIKKGEG